MHATNEMQPIVTDVRSVYSSVCLSRDLTRLYWMDQDAVWSEQSWGGPRDIVLYGGPDPHIQTRGTY